MKEEKKKSNKKKLVLKGAFTLALITLLSTVLNAFEPAISGQVAVQQLNDSIESNATMTLYNNLKQNAWVGYVAIPFIVFFKDIKSLFNK